MKIFSVLLFILTTKALAHPSQFQNDLFEEEIYNGYLNSIRSEDFFTRKSVVAFEQKSYVDALWDLVELEKDERALKLLGEVKLFYFDLIERLRIGILQIKAKKKTGLDQFLVSELKNTLRTPEVDIRIIYTLAAYEDDLIEAGHDDLIELAKTHPSYFDISEDETDEDEISDYVVQDLFYNSPDITTLFHGEYLKSVKIFMFCRENRLFPCLMVMRDVHGQAVRNEDGTLWAHPALASSSLGLPSYTRNGDTPAGVWTLDSTMPYADKRFDFGKYRRIVMHFVPKGKKEKYMKAFLPESSHELEWWKPSVIARNNGRNLFRIHGTGKINQDPSTPYYPFMRTAGCIAQRENTYDGITYKDQRILLDKIMVAMDLKPRFQNEVKIKGILYLMDIDTENAPVSLQDLAKRGIE